MPALSEIEGIRIRQENERLWQENTALRVALQNTQTRLETALANLKQRAQAETDILLRKDLDSHG